MLARFLSGTGMSSTDRSGTEFASVQTSVPARMYPPQEYGTFDLEHPPAAEIARRLN
jgi:hypothetical protein